MCIFCFGFGVVYFRRRFASGSSCVSPDPVTIEGAVFLNRDAAISTAEAPTLNDDIEARLLRRFPALNDDFSDEHPRALFKSSPRPRTSTW